MLTDFNESVIFHLFAYIRLFTTRSSNTQKNIYRNDKLLHIIYYVVNKCANKFSLNNHSREEQASKCLILTTANIIDIYNIVFGYIAG